MAGVREKLNAFLDKAAVRAFEWGVSDCALEVADWLDQSCGTDIANEFRGRYSTEEGANEIISDDLEAFMRQQCAMHGIAETMEPKFGDIGVVAIAGQELCAILMPSKRWRMKTAQGIALSANVTVLVAFDLPCRPKPPEPST